MRHLLATTLLIFIFPSIPAYAYCYEPSAPSCASRYGSFDDQWEFDRCKREMETYKSEIESYMSCNNRQAEEAIDEARRNNNNASSSYSDAVDSFNRRARY